LKKSGHWPLEIPYVGRGAHPMAPEAGAIPGTGRNGATFQVGLEDGRVKKGAKKGQC